MAASTESHLDQIVIASPCTEPWEGMRGDDRTRHCAACRIDVHNLAAMTRAEAEHLVGSAGGRLCARIYRRPDGTVLTADCAPARGRVARRLRRMRMAVTGVLAVLGFAGCRSAPQEGFTVTTGVVMPPSLGEAVSPAAPPAPPTPAAKTPADAASGDK